MKKIMLTDEYNAIRRRDKIHVAAYVERSFAARVAVQAKREDRSSSALVRRALEAYLQRQTQLRNLAELDARHTLAGDENLTEARDA